MRYSRWIGSPTNVRPAAGRSPENSI